MPSLIDETVPVYGSPTTQSVRNNFGVAKAEITDLQSRIAGGPFLALAGGQMNGTLVLNGPPVLNLHAATKAYVDTAVTSQSLWRGTYRVASNTPALDQMSPLNGYSWTAVTADPSVAEPLTVALPPLTAGTLVSTNDTLSYSTAQGWLLIQSSGVTVEEGDLRYVRLSGATMTGPLALSGPPSLPLGAATKGYVDGAIGGLTAASVGAVPLAGGTMTGPLVLSGAPTQPAHAATRQYVDGSITTAIAGYAPLNSPVFTGDPRGVTPALDDSDTSIPTTAWVKGQGYIVPPVNLAAGSQVTGVLPVANGGTGSTTGPVGPFLPRAAGSGNPLTGDLYINSTGLGVLALSGPTGSDPTIRIIKPSSGRAAQLLGMSGSLIRWNVQLGDVVGETGSNAGSNFTISRYNDAGNYIDTPLQILRTNGTVYVNNSVVIQPPAGTWAVLQLTAQAAQRGAIMGYRGTSQRWELDIPNNTAETGGNRGSDFSLARFNDAGVYLDSPLVVRRDTGYVIANNFSMPNSGSLWIADTGGTPRQCVTLWTDNYVFLGADDMPTILRAGNGAIQVKINQVAVGGWAANGVMLGRNNQAMMFQAGDGYTYIYRGDGAASASLAIGADGYNWYRNSVHKFQDLAASTDFCWFDWQGTHNASGAWIAWSDARVKEEVEPYTRGLQAIRQLQPVTFSYIAGGPIADPLRPRRLGLVAQEVQPHVPEIVAESVHNNQTLLTTQPSNLIYAVINAIKELADEVEALKATATGGTA